MDRGRSYLAKNYFDEAFSDFNKAIKINPQYIRAYYYRGLAYSIKEEFELAIKDYNKAIELDYKFFDSYYDCMAYMKLNRKKEAIDSFKLYIKHEGNSDSKKLEKANHIIKILEMNQ